jgi:hypothetical protein
MCHLLDPCGICRFISYVFYTVSSIVIFGYLGKGFYVFGGRHASQWEIAHDIAQPEFYVPDGPFWFFGIGFTVVIFALFGLMRAACITACKTLLCCGKQRHNNTPRYTLLSDDNNNHHAGGISRFDMIMRVDEEDHTRRMC